MSENNSLTPQTEEPTIPQAKTLTIRLPKFDSKTVLLALIAIITGFQTLQLYTLKASAKNGTFKAAAAPATAANASPSGGSGSNSALPQMVGGC